MRLKMCKKIFSVLICIILCVSSAVYSETYNFEDSELEMMIRTLSSLELIKEHEIKDFDSKALVTRAEFLVFVIRLLGAEEVAEAIKDENPYKDVDSNHWAAGHITVAKKLGIIGGYDGGNFEPDRNISLEHGLKMIVSTLGYDVVAFQNGGYPNGYMLVAIQQGLIRTISVEPDAQISKEILIKLLYNSLNVKIMVRTSFTEEQSGSMKKGETLREEILKRLNLKKTRGQVTATSDTTLSGESSLKEDEVLIDGVIYKVGKTNAKSFLGYRVSFYAEENTTGDMPTLMTMYEEANNNVVTIDCDLIKSVSPKLDFLQYWTNESSSNYSTLSFDRNISVIYNGKALESFDYNDFSLQIGEIKFLDYNNDQLYDVAFISEYESFVVDFVNKDKQYIRLKDGQKFRGKGSIQLELYDKDYKYCITDKNAEAILVEDIIKDDVISVKASKDERFVNIIVHNDKVTGTVEELDLQNNTVYIDGKKYKTAQNEKGLGETVKIGKNGVFYLDIYGNIFYSELLKSDERYCYIIESEIDLKSISPKYRIKILTADREIKVLEAVGKINIDGKSYSIKNLGKLSLDGTIIGYTLNDEALLSAIDTAIAYGSKGHRTFYEDNRAFISLSNEPFLIDDSTVVFFIPESGFEENYYIRVNLDDEETYSVQAYDFEKETQTAGAVVINTIVDSSMPGSITRKTPVTIVDRVSKIIDEDYIPVYKLYGFTDGEPVEYVTKSNDKINYVFEELRQGDVIKASINYHDKMDNILKLEELYPMPIPYHFGERSDKEQIFGTVYSVEKRILTQTSQYLMNKITISVRGDGMDNKDFNIPLDTDKDRIAIYIFDTKRRKINVGSIDDLKTIDVDGSARATKVFLSACLGKVQSVVIVE